MLDLLWLIPVLPLAGFLILLLVGSRIPRTAVAAVGTGSTGLSMIVSLLVATRFVASPPGSFGYTQFLWQWFKVGDLVFSLGFCFDGLSVVMVLVVTVVAFLIHLYSVRFMADQEGYSRFFAYMNLFVGSMLILVLADNLLFLYLGWEGVGLCSYLLIGFWYRDPANARAATKAFVVTRIGDTSLIIGFLVLLTSLGTLQIQEITERATQLWTAGSPIAVLVAALLLGGAVGKSAQLPLQTWLPDAMAGPTPVSALIHAATMVTAGVYLIARMGSLFVLAPEVQFLVAVVGAVTLLIAGASALVQRDIKRVLAYSTMSQVGYMFLALGVGAWSAAIFHFVTHAFFKGLLFLSAGVVIRALDSEHDIFNMGGLRKSIPIAFRTFLVGAASLSALPVVTAGFYSKEAILLGAWSSPEAGLWLWTAGIVGALLTSLYVFRVVFLVFYGEKRTVARKESSLSMVIPLIVLSVFSIVAGCLDLPKTFGNVSFLSDLIRPVLPMVSPSPVGLSTEAVLQVVAALASLLGVFLAGFLYLGRPARTAVLAGSPVVFLFRRFWSSGWGFDWLYRFVLSAPFVWIARLNKEDVIDLFYLDLADLADLGQGWLVLSQTGKVRRYAMAIALGAAVFTAIMVFL